MSGAHSTTFRYGGGVMQREHVGGYPEGMSARVRTRWVDPDTGYPREPTAVEAERAREQAGADWRAMPVASEVKRSAPKKRKPRPGFAVVVDGKRFPSIKAAAREIGCLDATLGSAMRRGGGRTTFRGHNVARVAGGAR